MAFINYDNIGNFPTSKRKGVHSVMSENNITKLINRLIDQDGYVITSEIVLPDDFPNDIKYTQWTGAAFEFVIRGYYFSIPKPESDNFSGLHYLMQQTNFLSKAGSSQDSVLYGLIAIDNTDSNYPELFGQDAYDSSNPKYQGIQFLIDDEQPSGIPQGYMTYKIPLVTFKADKNEFYVTMDSIFKYDTRSIRQIDGGEI